jgi:phosphorylated adapter RNA export protein
MLREPVRDIMIHDSSKPDASFEGTLSPEVLCTVVQELAAALGETEWLPLQSLRRIVRTKGVEFAQSMLREAQAVQAQGGLRWRNGSQRRTLGGVYFFLAKQHLSRRQQRFVFASPRYHLHHGMCRAAKKGACAVVPPSVSPEGSPSDSSKEVHAAPELAMPPPRKVLDTREKDLPLPPPAVRPSGQRSVVVEVTTARVLPASSVAKGPSSSRGPVRVWRSPDAD